MCQTLSLKVLIHVCLQTGSHNLKRLLKNSPVIQFGKMRENRDASKYLDNVTAKRLQNSDINVKTVTRNRQIEKTIIFLSALKRSLK